MAKSSKRALPKLPASLKAERRGDIALLRLSRPQKRNALDDTTVLGIEAFFSALPAGIKAVVLHGQGEHFSAGLDLSELTERDTAQGVEHSRTWHRAFQHIEFGKVPVVAVLHGAVVGGGLELAAAAHLRVAEGVEHSRSWHRAFQHIEFGKVPVVAVLHGAVVGGGLELAAAAHIRVAERSAYYALPEGSRGIYVGGGASVRLPRLIGVTHMQDMMFTGRVFSAEEGQTLGLSHYLVGDGEGLAKGIALAERIAENAPLTNFGIMHVLPRIAESDPASGYLAESLMAAIAQGSDEAKARLKDFLEKRGKKVLRG